MFNKITVIGVKLLCLLLAFTMVVGCSGNAADSSSDYEWEYEEIVVGGDKDNKDDENDKDNKGDKNDKDDKGDKDSSKNDAANNNNSNVSGNTSSTGKDGPTANNNKGGVNAEKYRGTTVRYATWKNPNQNEDGDVVDSFQKKYGIKVKIDMVPQATYVNEVAGMVASGNSPDIFFDNCFFPSSLAVLQPIDAMKLNLSDPIWDKGMLEMSKLGGKSFLVNTVGNIWAEVDCLFYNKKIFNDNNITTPEEYYDAGKWDFAALTKCMTDVKNAGYIGGYIDFESLLASTGAGFYSFKNGKFTNSVNDKTYNVMTQISQWVSDGLIKNPLERNLLNNFITGKAGIAITNAYGLKATGYFSKMNPNDIGFTYIPKYDSKTKAYTTGLFRGWGLIRGAKNPEAAGIFIRYYLDVNNYNTDEAFINAKAKNFFFKLTSGVDTNDKNPYMLLGIGALCNETTDDYKKFIGEAPGQVRTAISAKLNTFNSNANKVNGEITKQLSSLGIK